MAFTPPVRRCRIRWPTLELRRLLPIDSPEWDLAVERRKLHASQAIGSAAARFLPRCASTSANVRLLRVGEALTAEQRQLARQLGVESAIVELSRLSREVLAAAYRFANLLVHTADAEGFGLPPIEAMACGCQVIASDLPVLREVGGTAATYCAVGDIEGWKNAVVAAIEGPARPRQRLRQRGAFLVVGKCGADRDGL